MLQIKGLRNSQEELKNAINELQNKMETTTAWIEEAEERLGELEDKIMGNEEAEKKRDKKFQEYEEKIRELSDALKRNNIRITGIPEELKLTTPEKTDDGEDMEKWESSCTGGGNANWCSHSGKQIGRASCRERV